MSAQNKPSPSNTNWLGSLSVIPYVHAFELVSTLDRMAVDIFEKRLFDAEGNNFIHWAWANAPKVHRVFRNGGAYAPLAVDYFDDNFDDNNLYATEYDIKDTICLCDHVLHNKTKLKNESNLAIVYKVKVTALNKQGSYEKAVEAVKEAAFGHKVESWDVVEHLVSDLTEKGLDELVADIHFYSRNKRKYDEFAERKARKEAFACIVCMDASIQLVFSCGHAVTCESCYDKMKKKECPKCRKRIEVESPPIRFWTG